MRLPTAHGPKIRRTPNARSAHMLARYGTVCGENSCLTPCRGRNATSWSPTVPTVIGALGAPYGVSRLMVRAVGTEERVEAAAADDSEQGPLLVLGLVFELSGRAPDPVANLERVGCKPADGFRNVA